MQAPFRARGQNLLAIHASDVVDCVVFQVPAGGRVDGLKKDLEHK
jgi:hypothetical protein